MIAEGVRGRATIALAALAAIAGCSHSTSSSSQSRGVTPPASTPPTLAPSTSAPAATSASAQPVVSGTAGTGSGSGSAPGTPTTFPVPATPLRTVTAHSSDGDFVIRIWAEVKTPTCYDHAYGQPVLTYLTEHPCTGLDRLLATTTVDGRAVGLALSELGFIGTVPGAYQTAGRFVALVKRDGTGNLNDLFREGYRLPSGPIAVPSSDAFNALAQDAGVAVFDAWYLDGPTPANDPSLIRMTQDVFLQV